MKNSGIILLLIILFSACQDIKYPDKPKDLIPEDKMVEVIADLYLFTATKAYNRNALQESGLTSEKFIFKKHNIDSLQFEKSNAYYSANLELYGTIHKKAQTILEVKKTEIDTLISEINSRREDSITRRKDSIRKLEEVLKEVGE